MKKPVLPRIAGLLVLYIVVFVLLVMIQFTHQRGFSHQIDLMTITGHYGDANPQESGGYSLTRGASVFFGGMEFRLNDGDDGLAMRGPDGRREGLRPEYLAIQNNRAIFRLSKGPELIFAASHTLAGPELRITGNFGEEAAALEIPFRPMLRSRIRDAGGGRFVVVFDGISYSFGVSSLDGSRQVLLLEGPGISVSYRAVPEQRAFTLEDFLLPEAQDEARYRETLAQWREEAFSRWRIPGLDSGARQTPLDEEMIIAYAAETVARGGYSAMVSAVSPVFRRGNQRNYRSAVYLGALDTALQSLTEDEREQAAGLAQLIREGSLDYLKVYRFIEYCGVRGYGAYIDEGEALIQGVDSAEITPDLVPGILECYTDWQFYRSAADNPFERFIEPALELVAEGILQENGGGIFMTLQGNVDLEFNLRLGFALDYYGSHTAQNSWLALGRSLVLSSLAHTGASNTFPQILSITDGGDVQYQTDGPQINAAQLYHYFPAPAYPRAVSLGVPANTLWAWTAAISIQASLENNILDIAVSFPPEETHYILIRGVRPFRKIQLYGIDFRTDPQFERYDSSGWWYASADQTLLLKMKHQTIVEHIKIFF